MMTFKVHPLAAKLPMMTAEELNGLVDDIRANGQREDATLWRGQLIDGRNRLRACELLNIELECCELDDDQDPAKYIVSHNLHRRHMTASQKAMFAIELKEHYAAEAKERQRAAGGDKKSAAAKSPEAELSPEVIVPQAIWTCPNCQHSQSAKLADCEKCYEPNKSRVKRAPQARDNTAAEVGICGKLIDAADKVVKDGVPELAQAVRDKKVSVSKAAEIAGAPKAEQPELIEEAAKRGKGRRKPPPAAPVDADSFLSDFQDVCKTLAHAKSEIHRIDAVLKALTATLGVRVNVTFELKRLRSAKNIIKQIHSRLAPVESHLSEKRGNPV